MTMRLTPFRVLFRQLCVHLAMVLLAASATLAAAQTPAAKPAFEVATVKPNTTGCCTSSRWSSDQVIFSNQTLANLVIYAYNLQANQLVAPDWMSTARFDVTGRFPPGTEFADGLLMLRTLLQERFHLAVHNGTKEMQAYVLVVAPGGPKLKPAEPGRGVTGSNTQSGVRTFKGRKIPIFDLAYELADELSEPVVDQTGLTGIYDIQLSWSADDLRSAEAHNDAAADTRSAPSVFTAVQETLGLRLEHRKAPVPVVVVDRVDRTPSEN